MDEFTARLKPKGVEFVVESTQPRLGVKMAFFKGPDDVLFEVVEIKEN